MARVDYRGRRLLAQCILLGISDSTQYGCIENGENFYWNEELNSKVAEAVKRIHLEKHFVHDVSGNAFTLVAPATSKDKEKRRYILHFPRDTQSDANNAVPGSLFCILTPELISSFFRVAEMVTDHDLQHCSNEIIVRSAKHILKAVLRNIEDDHNQAVSHFFNCLFENVAIEVDAQIKEKTTNGASSSKTPTSYLSITPESLWSDIQEFTRYKY